MSHKFIFDSVVSTVLSVIVASSSEVSSQALCVHDSSEKNMDVGMLLTFLPVQAKS